MTTLLGQHEEAILLGEGQRPEQHAVHDAEHGRVGTDGECQRQDPGGREPRTLAEGPDRVAEVGEESVHHSYLRATIGSTFVARRAGRKHATSATSRSSAVTAPKVSASVGCTS